MEKCFHALVWLVIAGSVVTGNSISSRKEFSTRCGDWVPYKDEKCVKIAVTAGLKSQEDAATICESFAEELKLESSRPTLVTIPTKEKQQFLQNLLFVEEKLVESVWLGLKETGENTQVFKWNDGSNVLYANWAKQNISDDHHQCVEMKSGEDGFAAGEWVRVNCRKRNIVVCERSQALSLEKVQGMLLEYQLQQERLIKEVASLKQKNSDAEKSIRFLKQKAELADKSIEGLTQRSNAEKELISLLMRKNEASEKNITALLQKNDASEKMISNLNQRSNAAERNVNDLKLKHDSAEKNIVALKQKLETVEKLATSLKQRNDAAEKSINDLKQKLATTETNFANLKQQNDATVKTVTSLSQKDAISEKAVAVLNQKTEATEKTVATLKQKTESVEKNINDFKQQSAATDKNIATVKVKNDALEKNVNALTQKNAAAEQNIGALTQKNQVAQNEINSLKQNPVPVGFIYVELPGQNPPTTLWPQTKWADVSAKYAGLFFRVLGGGSSPFGQIQEGANPRLEQVEQVEGDHVRSQESNPVTIPGDGSWSRWFWDGNNEGNLIFMRFHLTKTEVRPRNQAVRIWQRIQ